MFYLPSEGHGLPHNPFNAIITPRPIGWISTRSAPPGRHDNLAPYSFFNGVAYTPPQVIFSSIGSKHSVTNIRQTGVFAVNIVAEDMLHAMNQTSAAVPPDVDEFALASIPKAQCRQIDCPCVANAPAILECRLVQLIPLLGHDNWLVHGQVVGIHLRDDCLHDGLFDITRFHPVARLGYRDFTIVKNLLQLPRPDDPPPQKSEQNEPNPP